MQKLKLYNAHCCGEVGDVIVAGNVNLKGKTILEQSKFLFEDKKLRNFLLNEPRGGVFKHFNLLVPPKDKKAKAGFIIMEPEDNPPMSGSNSMCVATVLLEKGIIKMTEPTTEFFLEAPGGIISIKAYIKNKKVSFVEIHNLPSFVDQLDVKLHTPSFGEIIVSIVFGGDSFVICNAKDFDLSIKPDNAKKFVEISNEVVREANINLGFKHPSLLELDYISFCQFIDPVRINDFNQKEGWNTVCIRPGKLDRSPCGTGTSARLALMYAKNEINVNEKFISKSIIGSTFESYISHQYSEENKTMIVPSIKGSAFITGEQEMYISNDDPFPEGYKLNDTWPKK
ncbi:MAG: Trans-3-hydroxy-L-proline dehydratase [Alphaproteobacteria bacterium MarineAlpha5_Bin5]|nr:MAG: Trans-3-hydroxy-L-proline dehydratase [Alphaproteobacteria bacterium MarineAlpha5_Bin5]PPR49829.1 MAG: Trans-3-hydroxy-L-proline dehydratase [Alphaproteobacteria bacterium MarineAlpha5_Bin4]|tara:strand:+ start:36 stop:1058 length:1023 start_codon:yes stop_codon:yes gene_type:complete